MRVAVQGCSHGSLSAIYSTVDAHNAAHPTDPVRLLLLCGDFQALRSTADFPSLAVPPKYHNLGTFHEYYTGRRRAPVLTLVIGGNHEASNYMWELYHGGWLAENIYYLGAAGSVLVDGIRVVGASGIFKDHDYNKGHFEKVPYNNSTLRSVYHIRQYDVAKLLQLSPKEHTVFLSHDWPLTIPRHGDTSSLLRRKPFFKQEVQTDTLGSPPLLELLKHVQPEHWFAAHLHVKFAAVYEHGQGGGLRITQSGSEEGKRNPDEIEIDDDDVEFGADEKTDGGADNPDEIAMSDDDGEAGQEVAGNLEEIAISDDEFDAPLPVSATNGAAVAEEAKEALKFDESADLVQSVRVVEGQEAAKGVIGITASVTEVSSSNGNAEAGPSRPRQTRFLALDKCGPGKDFIQFLDIPSPPSRSPPADPSTPPRLTFDPEWLAITRALHPFLSLTLYQAPLPPPAVLRQMIQDELERIRAEGLLVPALPVEDGQGPEVPELVWEKGEVDVGRVQVFWPTAPGEGQPGGSPTAWYTNPQTEAFCGMLGIENKINPAPRSLTPAVDAILCTALSLY